MCVQLVYIAQVCITPMHSYVGPASDDLIFAGISVVVAGDSRGAGSCITQQKVIDKPPTFVIITKKYQRHASTAALDNISSMSNRVSGAAG